MDQPPKKRRWQFSLKVLFIVMTMAAVGMGLINFWLEFADSLELVDRDTPLIFGWILLMASPGVLIGYGFNRFWGAIIGGFVSVLIIFISLNVFLFFS